MKEGTKEAVYGTKILDELQTIAERNGRRLWQKQGKAGIYATADKYTGADYCEGTPEDLLAWECGYVSAKKD